METNLDRAYSLTSPDDTRQLYSDWAPTYDHDLVEGYRYVGPATIARTFPRSCADLNARIIDIGCGTGLVGNELREIGYTNIHGLDLVPEMLELAKEKNVYQALYQGDLLQGTTLKQESFDAAISMGTFTHNHVGPHGLDEVIRLIRIRGTALISINAVFYESEGFASKLQALCDKHIIDITRSYVTNLILSENIKGMIVEILKLR